MSHEYLFLCHSTALLVAPNGAKTLRSGFKNTSLPMSTLTPQWQGQHSVPQPRLCYHILSARQRKIYPIPPIPNALFGTLPRTVVNSLANTMTSTRAQRLKLKPMLLPMVLVSDLSVREVTTQSSYNALGYCFNIMSPSFLGAKKWIRFQAQTLVVFIALALTPSTTTIPFSILRDSKKFMPTLVSSSMYVWEGQFITLYSNIRTRLPLQRTWVYRRSDLPARWFYPSIQPIMPLNWQTTSIGW